MELQSMATTARLSPLLAILPQTLQALLEGGWWDLDCCQNGRKHRTRFLPEKPLSRGRPICSREEKVVDRRQTLALSRAIEPSQLMVPQGEVPVASFHMGTGTLEHLGQLFGLLLELALLHLTQPGQHPTGLTQWRAQTFGQLPKRLAGMQRVTLGHPLEIA